MLLYVTNAVVLCYLDQQPNKCTHKLLMRRVVYPFGW